MKKRALVLIGSPRGLDGSNSARFARVMTEPFNDGGWSLDRVHLRRAVVEEAAATDLNAKVDGSDLILLAAPLYVDSLPAPVIRAFEQIAAHRRTHRVESKRPRFAVLLNYGFVEPSQNATAAKICRQFAQDAGFEWSGELLLGAGGFAHRRVKRLLREAGGALASGLPVPPKTRRRAACLVMPRWIYILGGNMMWRRVAKRFGNSRQDLVARSYAEID